MPARTIQASAQWEARSFSPSSVARINRSTARLARCTAFLLEVIAKRGWFQCSRGLGRSAQTSQGLRIRAAGTASVAAKPVRRFLRLVAIQRSRLRAAGLVCGRRIPLGPSKTECIDLPHLKRRGLRLGFCNLRRRAVIEGVGREGFYQVCGNGRP